LHENIFFNLARKKATRLCSDIDVEISRVTFQNLLNGRFVNDFQYRSIVPDAITT
jgi:hypothetical protein